MSNAPPSQWQNPFARTSFPASDLAPSLAAGTGATDAFTGLPAETSDRIQRMQHMLQKKLGPEYLSTRQGGGGTKLTYIEGWRVINLANEIFGFNGWFTEVKSIEVDFIDFNPETSRFNIGVSAVVRVWLRDGGGHEDVGYGKLENTKSKADGLDKCKKEAVTDALKRTLRNFGSVLGNCLYDKHYTAEIGKMKAPKPKFDFDELLRPSDVARPAPLASRPAPTPAPVQVPVASTSNVPPPVPVPVRTTSAPSRPPPAPIQRPPQQRPSPPSAPVQRPSPPVKRQSSVAQCIQQPDPHIRPQTADLFAGADDALFADLPLDEGDSGFTEGGLAAVPEDKNENAPPPPPPVAAKANADRFQQARREAAQRLSASLSAAAASPPSIIQPPPAPAPVQPHPPAAPRPGLRPAVPPPRRPIVQAGTLPSLGNVGSRPPPVFPLAGGIKRRFEAEGRPPLGELELVEGEVKRPRMGDEP